MIRGANSATCYDEALTEIWHRLKLLHQKSLRQCPDDEEGKEHYSHCLYAYNTIKVE